MRITMIGAIWMIGGCSSSSTTSGLPDAAMALDGATEAVSAVDTGAPDTAMNVVDAAQVEAGCPAARSCGANCCDVGSKCVDPGTGQKTCAFDCTSSSQCPTASRCCTLLIDGTGACLASGSSTNQQCRSTTGSECASGSCAPALDLSANPVGPYVCKPNDGAPYHGCMGALTFCSTAHCCVTDANGNQFCSLACVNDSNCGAAHCRTLNFSATTCAGPLACAP
jgi:hypothetical protein